ncbi:sugar ABC transporter permease [Sporosarcina sp. Marseille-Q4063]|uniref:carbohydrate ABC transporter permease n=1 Tax=Sporosarcina sp. Marseille-Q4063 TaxID=2810514 RepID=UPI001BAFBCEF|nr:sugar ABC transporter permease [Sporosarcina sp. Marseille-Q4063]QUW21264.1 sugar ABC transporter permease [Sporosarcina sp. Marseille-Q4063]
MRRKHTLGERENKPRGIKNLLKKNDNLSYLLMVLPAMIIIFSLAIIPIFGMTWVSLLDWNIASISPPKFIGLDNFMTMMKDSRFWGSLGTQGLLSFFMVTSQVVLGLAAALTLNNLIGKVKWLRGVIMAPFMVPPIVVALVWLTIFTPTISPINSFIELFGISGPSWLSHPILSLFSIIVADTWNNFPFVMIILLASLQGIPKELYEAVSVDGANKFEAFLYITLPSLKPAIILVATLRLIESFKSFPLIYVMTGGGPGTSTEVTNFYAFVQGFEYSQISYASSLALFLFLLTMGLSYFAIRLDNKEEV